MVTTLTQAQQAALEMIKTSKVCSAVDCYRHGFEALVKKGVAIKHHVGRQVTYTLAEAC